jgi:hypothetical protein
MFKSPTRDACDLGQIAKMLRNSIAMLFRYTSDQIGPSGMIISLTKQAFPEQRLIK